MEKTVVHNALVDVMLLVGIDDNTGLTSTLLDESDVTKALFLLQYEPHVISAISATDMVNFFPFPHRVASYPPDPRKESVDCTAMSQMAMSHRDRMMSTHSSMLHTYTPSKSQRSKSLNPKVYARHMSIRRPTNAKTPATNIPDLPISDEVIRSISSFCFPDGYMIYERNIGNPKYDSRASKPKSRAHQSLSTIPKIMSNSPKPDCSPPESFMHAFVLTNMHGQKYAQCMTFYLPGFVKEDDQGNIYTALDTEQPDSQEQDGKIRCYFPHCCVLISKYPYYNTLKECLSSMLIYIERHPEEMTVFLKDYAMILTHTPVPPAGNVAIKFKLYDLPIMLIPSIYAEKPVIDLPLHLTFLCFNAKEFLQILTCILVQEKIVFLSRDYALLSIIMESMMTLVLPFKWRFTYSTVLPSGALTYLESPGTFMYGVHSSFKYEVQQVEGLVLVDIDEGTVEINPDSTLVNNGEGRVPNLPREITNIFNKKWPQLKLQFDLIEAKRPFCYNMEELREWKQRRVREQNNNISHACLELMVNLFREVVLKVRVDLKLFNRDEFLREHVEDEVFYRKIFQTDMFKVFLEERMQEKSDYWSELAMKMGGLGLSTSKHGGSSRRRPSMYASQDAPKEVRQLTLLCLPEFTDVRSYIKSCVEQLLKALEVSDEYDEKTSLHYILALFSVANGNKMVAIENLIRVAERNDKIFPTKLLVDLYMTVSKEEKTLMEKKAGHKLLLEIIDQHELVNSGHMDHGMKIRMDPVTIPEKDLDYLEFEAIVSERRMCNDYPMIQKLFTSLQKQPGNYVDQVTFEYLVACWEDNQYNCNKVLIPDGKLAEEEVILKISSLVKTDFGLGRVCLTDKRLFFLQDVSNQYREIVKLREIKLLEQSEHVSLISKVPTLKILRKDGEKSFTIHLKEERNWWYMVTKEMWAGKVVAEAMKDVMMVQNAIQNTLLIDAIIASGQEECTTHHPCVEVVAESLSYYSNLMKEKKHILPPHTSEALQRKVDPNMTEKERKTVLSLLYTGGDESMSPRLWCGLSSGKIKVFDAIYWSLEKEMELTIKAGVACLKVVGHSRVWAGSAGIYIIDTRTITSQKTLMDHDDQVVDIVLHDDGKYTYTASVNGEIIKWNVQKLSHAQKKIKLNTTQLRAMKIFKENLICSTWSSIIICDLQGTVLKLKDMSMQIDGFTVTNTGQIWVGARREGRVYILDVETGEENGTITVECKGICSMAQVDGRVWIGTKDGRIKIYTVKTWNQWKELQAHEDAVRVLSDVRDRYIVSGGGSQDGRVCIWSSTGNTTDSGSFIVDREEIHQHF